MMLFECVAEMNKIKDEHIVMVFWWSYPSSLHVFFFPRKNNQKVEENFDRQNFASIPFGCRKVL